MVDRVIIDGLSFYAYHGVRNEETQLGQRFDVTIECEFDLSPAGRDDDYSKTVCYTTLADIAERVVVGRRYKLIESVAEEIAATILTECPLVDMTRVRVQKPLAPVKAIMNYVAVEIERRRDG